MLRRWKRRLFWTALLTVLAVLAIPATVAQATAALDRQLTRRSTMRKLLPVAVLAVLALAIGSGTLASASSSATTLTFIAVDIPKSELHVDGGAKGEGPGDTMFFRETLRRGAKPAGSTEVMCSFLSRNLGRCSGTLRIAGGTLEASAGIRFDGRFSLPIVGGTGTYAGARGVLTVIAVDEKRSRYEIELVD